MPQEFVGEWFEVKLLFESTDASENTVLGQEGALEFVGERFWPNCVESS